MAGSVLHTDAAKGYILLGREFLSHASVNHDAREYVRGDVSTNAAEGFFSQLKRSVDGLTTASAWSTCLGTWPSSTTGTALGR